MALSYKSRRRWSLVILVVGLPVYIIAALIVLGLINDKFGRPNILVELGVYVGLGIVWILPFKSVFSGIGQADPDAGRDPVAGRDPDAGSRDKNEKGGR
jgi:Protein of unknown function (DUF2842)